jgi:serine/threonine protein kinase
MAAEFDGWIRGEVLREGGQAWTYLAYKKGAEERTPFVLKVLKHKSNPARLRRFEREIEVGARLRHPNLVHVEAENIESDRPYIVMEYCSGGELRNLDLRNVSLEEKLRMFMCICKGVGYLHENKVIHRDLKPNNIFLRDDKRTPVVGDLGLCLIMEQDERLTEMTEAVGGRLFMAPELEDGRYEDAQPVADIYSLGKILYWLVSNKMIFSREKHRDEKYDLTRSDRTAGIAFVYHLLDGAITHTPSERRYSDATSLAFAVQEIIERIAVMAHAIDRSVPQDCTYCGVGNYQPIIDGTPQDKEFEWKAYQLGIEIKNVAPYSRGHKWLIMACDYCGNLQWFRTDLASKNQNAWQKGSRP